MKKKKMKRYDWQHVLDVINVLFVSVKWVLQTLATSLSFCNTICNICEPQLSQNFSVCETQWIDKNR